MRSLLIRVSFSSAMAALVLAACSPSADPPSDATEHDGASPTDASAEGDILGDGASSPSDGGALLEGGALNDASETNTGDASAPIDGSISVPNPVVRLIGRYDSRDTNGPIFSWPGSRVFARFTGSQVSVKLNETSGLTNETDDYDVLIDGVAGAPLHTAKGTNDYTLATGLANGVHTVEIHKRTEAYVGKTQFLGFTFAGGALLDPPTTPIRRIEFIGDSQIDGFGVEGNGPVCAGWAPASTHNARKGFVGLVASDFDAYHAAITISGKGLLRNEDRADKTLFSSLYPLANPFDTTSTWTPSDFAADLVVVVLGGTDYSTDFSAPDAPPNDAAFQKAYSDFIAQVRAAQPTAYILLGVGAQIRDYNPPGYTYNARTKLTAILNSVKMTRVTNGDSNVDVVIFPPAPDDASQETGCAYHGNPTFHRAMADYIKPIIQTKLGW